MAKLNYPEELTNLVEEFLTDGIISTKERQVLLNKAKKMGIDIDEFDLYIDAQQQKEDQKVENATNRRRGKTCPFCGAPVPQLTDKCPECGQFITAEASKELQEIFDHLENALEEFKSLDSTSWSDDEQEKIRRNKAKVEKYVRKARMYYGNNPKIKILLEEIKEELFAAEAKHKKAKKDEDREEIGLMILEILLGYWWVILIIIIALIVWFII